MTEMNRCDPASGIVAHNHTYDSSVVLLIPDGSSFHNCIFDDCRITPDDIAFCSFIACTFNGRAAEWYDRVFPKVTKPFQMT